MKEQNIVLRFLVLIVFFCTSSLTLFAQKNYKGKPKHEQPSIEVFSESTKYIFNQGLKSTDELKLNNKVDELFNKLDITGMTATILVPEKGIWETNRGFISKPNNKVVNDSSVFYWASVGKLITSTIVHQLILEKKLSFDDKLSKWFSNIQYSKKITIEKLLNHTNGIFSFNADSTVHYSNKYYNEEQLLQVSKAHKNLFKPGEYWSYTNTGYLLLALIIEKVESKTFEEVVNERIVKLLNLKTLRVAPKKNPLNLALAHSKDTIISKDSSGPLGAGNIISNSKDMTIFFSALVTGKIIPLENVHSMMKALYPMFGNGQYYGNGIMLYDFKEINNTETVWIGHSGGTENYKAILLFDTHSKIISAISMNQYFITHFVRFSIRIFLKKKYTTELQ